MQKKQNISGRAVRKTLRQKLVGSDLFCGYVFLAPFIIGFLTFTLVPMVSSLYLSFTEYDILSPAQFVGLKNYIEMFTDDPKFWKSFFVTIKYVVVAVPLRLIFALIVALILVKQTRLTSFYRAAYYLPSLIGGSIAVAVLWKRLSAVSWDDPYFHGHVALLQSLPALPLGISVPKP